MNSVTAIHVKTAVGRWASNRQIKRLALNKKLQKLTKSIDEAEDKAWVENSSSRTRSTEEVKVLQKGLNYSLGNTTSREYVNELERVSKSYGLPEQTRCALRQPVVPAIRRTVRQDGLSDVERAALDTPRKDESTVRLTADKG